MTRQPDYVWYGGYASNLLWERIERYFKGGILPETGRDHLGARDPSDPKDDWLFSQPGTVYFATKSTYWGGGRALYDASTIYPGGTIARIYLVTWQQFYDVVTQEMYPEGQRPLGCFDDIPIPTTPGSCVALGDGHYENLVCTGKYDGNPVITMAAPWEMSDVKLLAPSESYIDLIVRGLHQTVGWNRQRALAYLSGLPGSGIPGPEPHEYRLSGAWGSPCRDCGIVKAQHR